MYHDAYRFITYEGKGGRKEKVWNSWDAPAPLRIVSADGQYLILTGVNGERDRDYKPKEGELVLSELTAMIAYVLAERFVVAAARGLNGSSRSIFAGLLGVDDPKQRAALIWDNVQELYGQGGRSWAYVIGADGRYGLQKFDGAIDDEVITEATNLFMTGASSE